MNNEIGEAEIPEPQVPEPPVLEDQWDHEQIDALFRDLDQGATIQHVQVRTRSSSEFEKQADWSSKDRAVTLREAHELFSSGEAQAIQIRYEFDGQTWCDTLVVQLDCVRVIRTTLTAC